MGMSGTAPFASQRGAQHPKPNGAMSRYPPASTLKAPLGPCARDKKQKYLVLDHDFKAGGKIRSGPQVGKVATSPLP